MSATVWWTRSGDLGSSMQRARRSAIPSRRSISASTKTPASEVRRPPSKAARTALPATGAEKAPSLCRSMTRSRTTRDRLRPRGRARPGGGTEVDVGVWLCTLGLGQYEQAFRDHDVDAEVLPELAEADLERLGVASLGHRKRLLRAIAVLRSGPAAPGAAPATAGPAAGTPPAARPGEAERRQLTVMFVDLVGSTALSTRLDPEEMRDVLRAFQDAVTREVERFEGHLAKYMGDGVLAYFGYPEAHEDDAERAVRGGLALVGATKEL